MRHDHLHDEVYRRLRLTVAVVALLEAAASGALVTAKTFSDTTAKAFLWSLFGFAVVACVAEHLNQRGELRP